MTDRIAHAVIGVAIEVHRHLGAGLLESAYEHALAIELETRKLPFARQVPVTVSHKGFVVCEQRLDLVVDDLLVVELKAIDSVSSVHVAQVLSYLKAANLELGL